VPLPPLDPGAPTTIPTVGAARGAGAPPLPEESGFALLVGPVSSSTATPIVTEPSASIATATATVPATLMSVPGESGAAPTPRAETPSVDPGIVGAQTAAAPLPSPAPVSIDTDTQRVDRSSSTAIRTKAKPAVAAPTSGVPEQPEGAADHQTTGREMPVTAACEKGRRTAPLSNDNIATHSGDGSDSNPASPPSSLALPASSSTAMAAMPTQRSAMPTANPREGSDVAVSAETTPTNQRSGLRGKQAIEQSGPSLALDTPPPAPRHAGEAVLARADLPNVGTALPPQPAIHPAPADPRVSAHSLMGGNDVAERLGLVIAHRAKEGGDELTVRMHPAELGQLDVRLAFDDQGGLRAVVRSDNVQLLDQLRRDLGDLTRALGDAGVRTDERSFRFEQSGGDTARGGGDPSGERGRSGGGHSQRDGQRDHAREPQLAWQRPLRRSGRLDLTA